MTKSTYLEDLNTNEIVISTELAEYNSLIVGDTSSLESAYGEVIELQIVGLYSPENESEFNNVYTSVPTAQQFSSFETSTANSVTFYLDSVEEFKTLRREIHKTSNGAIIIWILMILYTFQ